MNDGIWIKKKDWGNFLLFCPSGSSHTGQVWPGVGEGMHGAYCWLLQLLFLGLMGVGVPAFPHFPPDWFKAVAGVGHSHSI